MESIHEHFEKYMDVKSCLTVVPLSLTSGSGFLGGQTQCRLWPQDGASGLLVCPCRFRPFLFSTVTNLSNEMDSFE